MEPMSQLESEGIESGNGHAADVIPGKELFRIGEVSRLTSTKQFVLRYWETEFPMLQPVKSPKGHRLYRREDVQTVLEIRRLLYDEGFTIAGARRHLREQNGGADSASAAPSYEGGAHRAEQEASGKARAAEHAHTARPVSAGGGAAAAPARAPIAAQPAASRAAQPAISRQVLLDLQDLLRELLTLLKSE
jgi:DNA-binding transcriptional MerR regulator